MLQNEYISAACNRVPNCLTHNRVQNVTLYASCNAVNVVSQDSDDNYIVKKSLAVHKDRVNCVRFIDNDAFVTASTDKTLILWKNFVSVKQFQGHEKSVNIADGANCEQLTLIASSSGDGTIRIWSDQEEK